jgi:F-type H+-transporting ATPase subunit epsilon
MTPFPFSLLTPSGALLNEEAVFVGLRSIEGSFGILARHAPIVAACPPGVVRVQRASGWSYYATTSAILSTDGHKVVVLTDRAENAQDEITARQIAQQWQQEAREE